MKYIDKIEIKYFRSLKDVQIKDVNDLNVISGKNDSGKSNVLKALDLFFDNTKCNFRDDYNKERLAEVRDPRIKGKQIIRISITFNRPKESHTLPPKFKISRTWDKNGKMINQRDFLETEFRRYGMSQDIIKQAERRLKQFLNKIKYVCVPSIRDEQYLMVLLRDLQNALFEAEARKRKAKSKYKSIITKAEEFNEEVITLTENLNEDFKKASGIDTNVTLPTNVSELLESLRIDTKHGDHNVALALRGSGIRMQYIPTILNHISTISPFYYIWGFDEPENSCEYSLCKKIASDFEKEYTS